mgnify:CR=1 FL=1
MQNGTIFEKSQNIFERGEVMTYLSDDELLDTEGGFTGWDDGTGAGAEETLEQALAEERLAELESEDGTMLTYDTPTSESTSWAIMAPSRYSTREWMMLCRWITTDTWESGRR